LGIGDRTVKEGKSAPATPARLIIATTIGNALEWLDFSAYALFAVFIAREFFPADSELASLLAVFGTFTVGFVMRPVGALVLGSYADRAGRRAALSLTILLMALGTAIIVFTPGYRTIGPAAPVLIVLARMLQGLSAGGEIGGAVAFLIEHAPAGKRGRYASWQQAGQAGAFLLAGLAGHLVTNTLTPEQVQAFGWRIPFLFGLTIAPVGFYIRWKLDETPLFDRYSKDKPASETTPVRDLFSAHRRPLFIGIGLVAVGAVCNHLANYMPTYLIRELKLKLSSAYIGLFVFGCAMSLAPVVGAWCDRAGRKPLMTASAVGMLLFAYPSFWILNRWPGELSLILVQFILGLMLVVYAVPGYAVGAELFYDAGPIHGPCDHLQRRRHPFREPDPAGRHRPGGAHGRQARGRLVVHPRGAHQSRGPCAPGRPDA
jgi:MHS family proline/betaine transporter-like MFS transporter